MNSPKGGPQAEREFRPLSGTNILQTPHIYIYIICVKMFIYEYIDIVIQ